VRVHRAEPESVYEEGNSNSCMQMNFRGLAARVCGVDLDPRVVDNPALDEGRVANADRIPYENERFDVVFSDNVLEHLDEPLSVFREVARVLKPGGRFLFKTPKVALQCRPSRV
jgi:SAM-dependent methyltransferase